MLLKRVAAVAIAAGMAFSSAMADVARAGDASGNVQIKVGYSGVFWDNDNRGVTLNGATIAGASGEARDLSLPTATLGYFLTKNIGLELFCCFAHAKVHGAGTLPKAQLADTWTFPPALTLKYHFDGLGPVVPYVGVGAQWVHYFNERSKIAGFNKASFDDSFGVVLQAGMDFNIGNGLSFGLDVKKSWLDTKITWTDPVGNRISTRHDLDPLIVTANIGYRFNLFGRSVEAPLK